MLNMREISGKMFSLRLTGESRKSFKPIHHKEHEGAQRKNRALFLLSSFVDFETFPDFHCLTL